MYFNYHAKIKKLITSGRLYRVEVVESYRNISPAMVFYFDDCIMPVRYYTFYEYMILLDEVGFKKIDILIDEDRFLNILTGER